MRSTHNILLVVIILLSLLIGASTLTRGHEWGGDFASYIMQAQSILAGKTDEFIEHNAFTIFESSSQIGPVAYPWGYPLLLTPSLLLKGIHPLTLKLPSLFLFAGFLLCLYLLTVKRLSPTESILVVSLFAFNPILVKFLDQILSDIPLLFFTILGLLLVLEFETKPTLISNVLSGIVLFFAFFVRTTGIILFASFLAYQATRFFFKQESRKNILSNSVIIILSFCILWLITSLIFPNGQGSYLEQVKGLTPATLLWNVLNYFHAIGSFFATGPLWTYIYYVLFVFFLIGLWTRYKEDLLFAILFFSYLSAMIFWPEWQGIRFAFPLLPIFVYFVFWGIRSVIGKLPDKMRRWGRGVSTVFWLTIIAVFLFNSSTRAYSNLQNDRKINGPFESYSDEVFSYIKNETSPDSVVIFFKPRAFRLFTDRDSIMVLECENLLKGDYFVQHKNWEYSQILPDEIDACNLPLKTVFENRKFIVYEIPK